MNQPSCVILRLTTGEDVVGMTTETKTHYQVATPFKVLFRRLSLKSVGLVVVPWSPDELLEEHTFTISKSQVVCTMKPKKEFIDYYHRISDEFYMTLVNLDASYRQQLTTLEKQSKVPYPLNSHLDSNALFGDDEDDDDTVPPIFH